MSDDNVTPLRRPLPPPLPPPTEQQMADNVISLSITELAEMGLIAFVGDGTDNVHLTPAGLRACAVLIVIAKDTTARVPPGAYWDMVLVDLVATLEGER
jgi:hypothetical protein